MVEGGNSIYRPRRKGWRVKMQRWMEDEGRLGLKEREARGLCFLKSIAL